MKFFKEDLIAIVERASMITERLSDNFIVKEVETYDAIVNSRLDKWCQVVAEGDWGEFEKRLAWDELELGRVRQILGSVYISDNKQLPAWADTLNECIKASDLIEFDALKQGTLAKNRFLDPQKPLPFEEVLLSFIYVARQKLKIQAGSNYNLLSDAAHACLERNLLEWIALLCMQSMELEFSVFRATRHSTLVRCLRKSTNKHSRRDYQDFIKSLLEGRLLKFFKEYSVLGRLVATATDVWVNTTEELISRLALDWNVIQDTFQPQTELGQVIAVQPNLSDRHHNGRSVTAITFASGFKLLYKPKSLEIEKTYFKLLEWFNRQGISLPFKLIKVISRTNYGWVEFVETVSYKNKNSAKRYYQRIGILLCLTYILDATDLHYENIISCDEHPVLIDLETLMHPWVKSVQNPGLPNSALFLANQQLWHSVLRSGLLPQWEQGLGGQVYSVGGLQEFSPQENFVSALELHNINSDTMRLGYEDKKNKPLLSEVYQERVNPLPDDYLAEIIDGFSQMYQFMLQYRQKILDKDSPFQDLNDQSMRFVFRATSIYAFVFRTTLQPKFMREGVERSIQLDILSRVMLSSDTKPLFWSLLKIEQQALERMDIPLFAHRTDSNALTLSFHQIIDDFFTEPSFKVVISRLNKLNEKDLERQISLIKQSLAAYRAHETYHSTQSENFNISVGKVVSLTHKQIVQQAMAIATDLQKQAILSSNGSATWIAPQYIPGLQRFRLQPMDYSLFDGICGVALFLAALEKTSGGIGFRDLALGAIQSFHQDLLSPSFDQIAKQFGISGAVGCSSFIYVLVRISQFLAEPVLLKDAKKVASLIVPDLIATDDKFDIISGAGGAILGLLALYNSSADAEVLNQAITCGHHLLNNRIASESGYRAWATIDGKLLTGFSHGAAGIAYALLRLYQATGEIAFLDAAQEGIAYERSVFMPEVNNWPDLRRSPTESSLTPKCDWAHGATGIGLARVAGLDILDTPEIRQDIEAAVKTTMQYKLGDIDHLCNGNLGRVEFLFTAAKKLSQPRLLQAAMTQATQVVDRAKQKGTFGYAPFLSFHPGFFQGAAGIGYELLRLAYPDQLPSVLLWE